MGALAWLVLAGMVWVSEGGDSLLARADRIELEGVALRPGAFELAPARVGRAAPPAAAVWRAARDARGGVWLAATGGVWRLGRAGAEKVFEREDVEVMALAVAPDGTAFFGVTPGGEVWRARPGAKPDLHFSTGEGSVFDLALGRDGALYAATGPAGRLWRISGGQGTVVFAAPQMHLLCVEAAEGGLLVGTAPDGIVYRVSPQGAGPAGVEVVFDSPLAEARAALARREWGAALRRAVAARDLALRAWELARGKVGPDMTGQALEETDRLLDD